MNSDFLLVHDSDLESETSGVGPVNHCTPQMAKTYWIRHRDQITRHPPALLSEVVKAFLDHPGKTRLQLDYKAVFPSTDDEPLRRLTQLIEPLQDRLIVSSGADWHLRKLRRLAPWLDLGFDIGFYLDWRDPDWKVDPRMPPYQRGAYDYHDDHILARSREPPTAAYLAERCDALALAVPESSTWYVSHYVIAHGLDDGFNMAAWLHEQGIKLDAWTLDANKPVAAANARRLRDAGVDLFTTNTPYALASLLTGAD